MPQDDSEVFRDIFNLFDKQGEGTVDCSEIGEMLRAAGVNPTEADIQKTVRDMDPNGNNRITFEEFLPVVRTQMMRSQGTNMLASFLESFRVFDRESNGLVSVAEVRHMLTSLGERLSANEVDDLVSGIENNHGMINYEEFVRCVMEGGNNL